MSSIVSSTKRDSSIELFRIIAMMVIVAHHYVVNSQITWGLTPDTVTSIEAVFCILYGWGGKTGINCFMLITGYFMCKSNISLKKYLKLLLEIEFYKLVIYFIFVATGYTDFSLRGFALSCIPIFGIGTGFIGSFLVFYLCIPFVNILIKNMEEKMHLLAITLA